GIRVNLVTGLQTCALPIAVVPFCSPDGLPLRRGVGPPPAARGPAAVIAPAPPVADNRLAEAGVRLGSKMPRGREYCEHHRQSSSKLTPQCGQASQISSVPRVSKLHRPSFGESLLLEVRSAARAAQSFDHEQCPYYAQHCTTADCQGVALTFG